MIFIMRYLMVDDFESQRKPFRESHLAHIKDYAHSGRLLFGGACGVPISEGVIVFDVDAEEEIHNFVKNDIYYREGIVKSYEVLKWHLVVGNDLFDKTEC